MCASMCKVAGYCELVNACLCANDFFIFLFIAVDNQQIKSTASGFCFQHRVSINSTAVID